MNSSSLCSSTTGSSSSVFPLSAFSAFHLLRNYNYLISPQPPELQKQVPLSRLVADTSAPSPTGNEAPFLSLSAPQNSVLAPHNFLAYAPHPSQQLLQQQPDSLHGNRNGGALISPCGSALFAGNYSKRQRGEKKPIPDEQKDDKYYERRRRNNQAAKKSRDARKLREDQIALRATLLEHENAILKAQILTLREEASSLRQMLMQKKSLDLNPSQLTTVCK